MLATTRGLIPWHRQLSFWFGVIGSVWIGGISQAAIIFQDNFDYVVDRNASNVEEPFRAHGWTDVKANNSYFRRGYGYAYTTYNSTLNSQVLVLEAHPSQEPQFQQTDFWVKYGSDTHAQGTVPPNVWFQFWVYATPESQWYRQKFIYPCRGSYPCSSGRFLWLMGYDRQNLTGIGDGAIEAPPGGRFILVNTDHANYYGGHPWNRTKLFQNVNQTPMLPGIWYQVRIHVDTSGPQGTYEAWIRQRGTTTWTKVSEWIGGVTRNFEWPIPETMRDGNRQFAMPTTVNRLDSTLYIDDFIMATSLQDLESRSSGSNSDTTPPAPPQNPRIAQ